MYNRRFQKIAFLSSVCALILLLGSASVPTSTLRAQGSVDSRPPWMAAVYAHVMIAPLPAGEQVKNFVETILPNQIDPDPTGLEGTYSTNGVVAPGSNPFFESLGTNGRTCATCHQPATGMSVSAVSVQDRYQKTRGLDPLFAPVDGANCPDAVQKSPELRAIQDPRNPHSLLLTRGVLRVALPWPPKNVTPEFSIEVLHDPTACEKNAIFGLNSSNPVISVYRRPLMAANLKFVTTPPVGRPATDPLTGALQPIDPYTGEYETGNIMFDGREPTLQSQAFDAVLTHEQAKRTPSPELIQRIVDFENGLYGAQVFDNQAGVLTAYSASGGPRAIASRTPGLIAAPDTFDEYTSWASLPSSADRQAQRESVARGQATFNSRTFTISNVAGFNDIRFIGNGISGTCATCHNTTDAGNDVFVVAQRDLGAAGDSPAAIPAPDLPLFKLTCAAGKTTSYNGSTVIVRDPGRALITGKCSDIGKLKVPQLRALSSRAPYFHDGSAQSLSDVINFYNERFSIGFSPKEKEDLINFLKTL